MARLSSADYCGILDVLHVAGESDSVEPFPEPVLASLTRLIPCDLVSYGDFDSARRHRRPPYDVLPATAPPSPDVRRLWASLRHTDPLLPSAALAGRALRISDVLTRRQWHEHPIYRAIGCAAGVEHMLRVWLVGPRGIVGGFDFDRGGRDFSERDRLVLEALAPHLLQLRLRARSRAGAAEQQPRWTLTVREREILSLVAAGSTNRQIAAALCVAPGTVRKHLDNVYGKLGVSGRAAAVAVTGARAGQRASATRIP